MTEETKQKWVKLPDAGACLTLFFIAFLFFYDLFQGRYLLTERDLASYFIPPRFFWVESLKQGDFPLWNPYQFSGHPFLSNPQHGLLYPLNSLFLLLPFDIAFNGIVILHFFLAGFLTYLLVRDFGASPTGSLLSGLTFMLGGYLLSVHSLLTVLLSVVWTPLILMFFRRAMIHPGTKNEILAAIFMTLSFLGGGMEIVYGNGFVLLFMVALPTRSDKQLAFKRKEWRGVVLKARSLIIVLLAFFVFSSIQLLPFLELWRQSIRGEGLHYPEATIWSFAPKDFLLFFLPDAYGYWLDMKKYWIAQCWLKTMYTGGLPFILSLVFFFSARRGGSGSPWGFWKNQIFFLALMIFSLFLSLGRNNPFYSLVYGYLPFFNAIRYPVKFLYIFILCLAVTAGLGFERMRQFSKGQGGKGMGRWLMFLSLLSGLALVALVLGHQEVADFLKSRGIDFPQFNHLSTNLYHSKRFLFYLTLFFLLLRIGCEVGWKGWSKLLIVFFFVADLFGNMGFYGKESIEEYFKKTKIAEILSSERGPYRIFSTPKTISLDTPILLGEGSPFDFIKEKHLPSFNMLFRLHDLWGNDVVRLKRTDDLYRRLTSLPSISESRLLDLFSVSHVISVTMIEGDPRFELVYARLEGLKGNREDLLKENTIKLYRRRNPLPRAWLVRDYKVLDPPAMLERLANKDFDPEKEAFLEEKPSDLPPSTLESEGKVEWISERNNRISLRVETKGNSLLILGDTYYPGWKAWVNQREEKLFRANYNFRAIVLPPGVHQVEFVYSPLSFRLGVALTAFGILGCLIRWRAKRRGRTVSKRSEDGD